MFVLEPAKRFVDNDLAGVAFQRSDGFAVADEVAGVVVGRFGVVPGGKPVIESVFGGSGLFASVRRQAEMPFADVGGLVAVGFEELGDGGFTWEKVRPLGLIMDP